MTNKAALARRAPETSTALATGADVARFFSDDQRALILKTFCGGASPEDAEVLIGVAAARGMNPLLGECYFVKRWDSASGTEKWAVQASIDAFRIKAEETGDYGGQDEPEYEYNGKGEVVLARVKVYRRSLPGRAFAVGVARWDEYVQTKRDGTPTKFWAQMPHNQLAKCAEAIALRKAFPKVLARLYVEEEMQRGTVGRDDEAPPTSASPGITKAGPPSTTPEVEAEDEARAVAAIQAEIAKARSKADMKAVAANILRQKLSDRARDALRADFEARQNELKEAARKRREASADAPPPADSAPATEGGE
jgi:phage recombination protein Bet